MNPLSSHRPFKGIDISKDDKDTMLNKPQESKDKTTVYREALPERDWNTQFILKRDHMLNM